MTVQHEIQQAILLKLIHNPTLSFSELWPQELESNKFAYHLSALESKGLVLKREGKYSLSEEGKSLSSSIEGDTGKLASVPTVANALIIRRGDKVLVQRRLKEPFYGIWSLISGKINFGWNVEECAQRDLVEETGLTASEARLVGMNQIKTLEAGKLAYHHVIFFVELSGIKGNLREKTHKGENAWMTVEEYKKRDRFPDPWFNEVLDAKSFVVLETERIREDGKFTSCRIVSHKEIGAT